VEHDSDRAGRDHVAQPQPVLIVDDDRICCAFVAEVVSRAGYAIEQVSTGAEAVAFARRQRPAAVVSTSSSTSSSREPPASRSVTS
jgi:DNA-binding NtrC family response regulator